MANIGTETGGYPTPAIMSSYLGSGTATLNSSGNVFNAVTVTAGTALQPGATGADNVLAVFSIPANTFDGIASTNRGLSFTAIGSVGATTNNKRIKIIYNPTAAVVGSTVSGGTVIADTGSSTVSGAGWSLGAQIFKYGAAGSNTQLAIHQSAQVGGAVSTLISPAAVTATENAAILVAVTGNAATATSDIILNFFEPSGLN